MITFDEYKEICAKWGLVPVFDMRSLPSCYKFNYNDENFLSGLFVCHYNSQWGVKTLYNLNGFYGPWRITKDNFEEDLSRITKLAKEYNINMKKRIIEQEFCK